MAHMDWALRSKSYDKLKWAKNSGYLENFLSVCCFKKSDFVLDIGTGTGVVARAASPYVRYVCAIDISPEMLKVASAKGYSNIVWKRMDARKLALPSNYFDKVTARMVFHHILDGREKAIKECWRVLKPGGMIIFSEGVPPDEIVKPRYDEIFKLKEERVSFLPREIKGLLEKGGFKDIKLKPFWMRRVSTREWLVHSGLKKSLIEKILKLHSDSDDHFKEVYNMEITKDDVIVDWKFIIAIGNKRACSNT